MTHTRHKKTISELTANAATNEEAQETLALLKILALGNQDIETGNTTPIENVIERLRAKQ